jgi:hypothetical protein
MEMEVIRMIDWRRGEEQRSLKQQHGFGVGALGVVQTRSCFAGGDPASLWALICISLRRSVPLSVGFSAFFFQPTLKLDGGVPLMYLQCMSISQTCMYAKPDALALTCFHFKGRLQKTFPWLL